MSDTFSVQPKASPIPPHPKAANHHWLQQVDFDGNLGETVVLQWNPGAQRWSHSGNVGTGIYINTEGWRYVAPCPMPESDAGGTSDYGSTYNIDTTIPHSHSSEMLEWVRSYRTRTGATYLESKQAWDLHVSEEAKRVQKATAEPDIRANATDWITWYRNDTGCGLRDAYNEYQRRNGRQLSLQSPKPYAPITNFD
jgi:hypothetical protein